MVPRTGRQTEARCVHEAAELPALNELSAEAALVVVGAEVTLMFLSPGALFGFKSPVGWKRQRSQLEPSLGPKRVVHVSLFGGGCSFT